MVVNSQDVVTWDSFWKVMGLFMGVFAGAWAILVKLIWDKASGAELRTHTESDAQQFEQMSTQVSGIEGRTREDMRNLAERIDGRLETMTQLQENRHVANVNRLDAILDRLPVRGSK